MSDRSSTQLRRFTPLTVTLLAPLLLASVAPGAPKAPSGKESLVYVGTYTRTKSKGIYAYRFQAAGGKVTPLGLAAETPNPSFVTVHPNLRFLYAANENGEGGNAVSAFSIDTTTGKLTFLNKVASGGRGPAHVAVDSTGQTLFAANYGSGSVASFPIHKDGSLGEAVSTIQHEGSSVDARQKGPHAHFAVASPDNRFVLVADLGLDKILIYKLDAAKSTIVPNDPPFGTTPPGSGPRHLAFHPNGKFVFSINEIKSTVSTFSWQAASGTLKEIATVPALPQGFDGKSTAAEIAVDRKGKTLYVSNRGHDSIAVFSIDASTGKLTLLEHVGVQGKGPRAFTLDPTGTMMWVANQNTDNTVLFRVDPKTGRLTATGQVLDDAAQPVSVQFVPVK